MGPSNCLLGTARVRNDARLLGCGGMRAGGLFKSLLRVLRSVIPRDRSDSGGGGAIGRLGLGFQAAGGGGALFPRGSPWRRKVW